MIFNTDLSLWDSPASRKAYPRLSVNNDGCVFTPTNEVVARFLSAGEAKLALRFAGWHFSGPHGWTESAATLASADMPAEPAPAPLPGQPEGYRPLTATEQAALSAPAGPDWAVLGPRLAEAKAKAIKDLLECGNNPDTELAHSLADDALCDVLRAIGCEDVVAMWDKVSKWYA